MPLSTTLALYGLSIAAGVVLAVYGLLHEPRKATPEGDPGEQDLLIDMPSPSAEPVSLKFKDECTDLLCLPIEGRTKESSPSDSQDLPLAWHPGATGESKSPGPLRRIFFSAPFAWMHRKPEPEEDAAGLAAEASATVLAPKQQKAPKAQDEQKEVPASEEKQ